jgi:hypothetical protein
MWFATVLLRAVHSLVSTDGMVSTPDMPGTIWETWDGDQYTAPGSKNHPMFTGGMGVYLYEDVVGIRFRHVLPQEAETVHEATIQRLLLQCLELSGFAMDLRATFGFSTTEALAICEASRDENLKSVSDVWRALRSRISPTNTKTAPSRTLVPTVLLRPDPHVVSQLGSASGWVEAPQGRIATQWHTTQEHLLTISVQLPMGVHGHVALRSEFFTARELFEGHHQRVFFVSMNTDAAAVAICVSKRVVTFCPTTDKAASRPSWISLRYTQPTPSSGEP